MPLLCFIVPTIIPVYCWNETWGNGYFVPTVLRYVYTLNMTWLVNSAAHMFGNKPYDKLVLFVIVLVLFIELVGFGKNRTCRIFRVKKKPSTKISNFLISCIKKNVMEEELNDIF